MVKKPKIEARPIVRHGEVWDTSGRRGNLRLRFLEEVDFNKDDFFQAEIVDGRAQFISDAYRAAQRWNGVGLPGTGLTFRTSLITLVELVALPWGRQFNPKINVKGRIIV